MTGSNASLQDLGNEQLRLLRSASDFLVERAAHGVNVALDPECYLNSWANAPGHARLRRLAFGSREEPNRLVARAKDALRGLLPSDYEVLRGDDGPANADTLLVSWSRGADLHGEAYSDRYLRLSSSDTRRTLWFLISLDGSVPDRLPPGVKVLRKSRSGAHSNSTEIAGIARRGGRGPAFSGMLSTARTVAAAVERELRERRFRQVLMPYEAQPFQHGINLAVKAHDPAIATIGYLHSALPALPTDLLYRHGAPDRLLVHGAGQREILVRHLGWPAAQVEVIPSLRYRRGDPNEFHGRILLPYAFHDGDAILNAFENYLREAPLASLPAWTIRNHPVMSASRRHAALASRLERLCEKYADRTSSASSVAAQCVIVGATAAVVEALERGVDVVHLCANPLFETHTSAMWNHLQVEGLGRNVYRYRLLDPGSYIALGGEGVGAPDLGIN